MTKYIIKDIEKNLYWSGDNYGWCDRARMADAFDEKIDAKRFADGEPDAWYIIIEIYIVES